MQPIKHALARKQDFVVEIKREWAFKTRLILRMAQQAAELRKLVLEVELPFIVSAARYF